MTMNNNSGKNNLNKNNQPKNTSGIKIITEGHDFEHNVWLVASLFFRPDENVKIVSGAKHENGLIHSDTSIECDEGTFFSSHEFECADNADSHTKGRIISAVCGTALYKAAQQFRRKRLPWGVMTGIRPAKPIRTMLEEGVSGEDAKDRIMRLYCPEKAKLELAFEVAKNELELIAKNSKDDMGLYIGIPFCPTRCLYCSFISTDLRHTKKYVSEYLKCLIKEIEYSGALTKKSGKHIQSIYIGGGTPTSLSADELDMLLCAVEKNFDTNSLYEYCVEAGRPDTITYEKLCVLKNHGVTRISINPQTMHERTLELIGRMHTSGDIENAFSLARKVGFKSINADLIAGLPGENEADFLYTLEKIDSYKPENITVHTMSVKRGSALHQRLSDYNLTNPETVYNMLDMSHEFMTRTNRMPYYLYRQKNMLGNLENVGYSIKGHESIYNVNIMEEVQSILALGCGGSSKAVSDDFSKIERVFNFKAPYEYIDRFDEILAKKDEFFNLIG